LLLIQKWDYPITIINFRNMKVFPGEVYLQHGTMGNIIIDQQDSLCMCRAQTGSPGGMIFIMAPFPGPLYCAGSFSTIANGAAVLFSRKM